MFDNRVFINKEGEDYYVNFFPTHEVGIPLLKTEIKLAELAIHEIKKGKYQKVYHPTIITA